MNLQINSHQGKNTITYLNAKEALSISKKNA